MKSLLIIFFLFCCAGAAFTQHVPSSCDAPDSVKRMYREDAAWLTYRYEIGNDSHYADSVTILQNVQNIFLEGLLAVRNAVSLPAVDTLTHFSFVRDFEKPHPFRSFHPYFLRQIELFIDTTIPWEKNLAHAKIPTGNGSFDSLIEIFGITFDSVYKYYSDFWVGVTHIPYNVLVLDSLINRIATPQLLADQYGFVGDGDRIEGRIEGKDTMILTYSVGWGDCPNGCISRRYWRFTVYPDCSVQYDSSYGDPLLQDAVEDKKQGNPDLVCYPNPASGTITIETQSQNLIEIRDVLGNAVDHTVSEAPRTELDVTSFPKGIYFIQSTSKKGNQTSIKFIKK